MQEQVTNKVFAENQLEQAIIELFKEQGFVHVLEKTIKRTEKDILLLDDLRSFILDRYENEKLTELELKQIINKLLLISAAPLYSGSRKAFKRINNGFDLTREDTSKIALHIDFIDFDNPEKNIFKVVNQYSVQGNELCRPDLLIFINGIPVLICEFKSAIRENTTIYNAWEQITNRYKRDIPNLMKYCFLSVISDGANTKLGTVFTSYNFYYPWNKIHEEDTAASGISSLKTLIQGALSKKRLLAILRDFIFYPDHSKKEEVIVCRYPQFFGAVKLFENIKEHLKPNGDGKGGTYFGATGCGKTYTMLFLARLLALRDNERFNNPTIIIITDREDLDTQASELFVTAKDFLHDNDVRSIENREDLSNTLRNKPSGGVYLTTIQKFCEKIGLLSERNNIICISDEAHRTQINTGSKIKKTDEGVFVTYSLGYYLRTSFPNAVYCGFTGTPIDETLKVFGRVVDSYTMKEACEDEITVRISYEPRLARVLLSDEQAKEIQKYYDSCAMLGATEEQIEKSKRAMSKMTAILGHPERLQKLAEDIVTHYEALCNEKPNVVQKAMIVCADRKLAYRLYKKIIHIRPEWAVAKKTEHEENLTKEELDKLVALPKINLVATRDKDDEKELYECCGSKEYRKMLDRQFKNDNSNFKIAIVVDMWITGFDVPSLAVMYIDKPLQKHTLVQTISRVNRVFEGKEKGIVVDYIGIKKDMLEAMKKYGGPLENPVDELNITLEIFRNHLALLDELMTEFDSAPFYSQAPLERLNCLNIAAEFVQTQKKLQQRFMGLSLRLKNAYLICSPSGELSEQEISKAQFYMAVRSILYKQTKENVPDTEMMNQVVENMVREAITCTGIENIVTQENNALELYSEEFLSELEQIKLPITKFNALLKLLKKAISTYSKINKVKAIEFDERLKKVVELYNNRDDQTFINEVVTDFVDQLSDKLLEIYKDLKNDKSSFKDIGVTFEEKAFYDILVKVRDEHKFEYEEEKSIALAKEIKKLVDDKSKFADWHSRNDIKNQLEMELIILLKKNGYPPEWNKEVFLKVMEQTENYKKHE